MKEIETIEVWIAKNEDGTEGIVGAQVDGEWLPLVSGDPERNRDHMRRMALFVKNMTKVPMRLKRFTLSEIVEELE